MENPIILDLLEDKMIKNLVESHKTSIHIALLLKRNKVIAIATNKIGSRSRGAGWSDCTIHAERNVVKELGDLEQLRGSTMYVFRISRAREIKGVDKIKNSEPCYDCHKFLTKCMMKYGLRKVFYSTNEFVELNMDNCPQRRSSPPPK